MTSQFLDWVEAENRVLIRALEQVDAAGSFQQIVKDNDRRRLCGVALISTFLETIGAAEGKLLKYDRSLDQQPQSSVSFASLALD